MQPSFRRWAVVTIVLAVLIGIGSSLALVLSLRVYAVEFFTTTLDTTNRKLKDFLQLEARHVFRGRQLEEAAPDLQLWLERYRGISGLQNMFVASDDDTVIASLDPKLKQTQDLCAHEARLGQTGTKVHPGQISCHKITLTDKEGQVVGSLVVHEETGWLERARERLLGILIFAIPTATGVMLLLLGTLAGTALRRLRALEEERRRSERLTALGQLSAALAHEIRNPLNAIALSVEVVARALRREGSAAPMLEERLRTVDGELRRLKGLLDDFVDAARPPGVHPMACDLAPTLRQSLAVFQEECAAGGVRVELEVAGALPARADAERIGQVLRNLVRNSLEAMQENEGPKVLRVRGSTGNGRVTIEVTDNGPGIPGEVLPRIFEPWFSTKKNGLGLGLALSRSFVESHGGSLEAVPGPGRGTTFRISLPGGEAA